MIRRYLPLLGVVLSLACGNGPQAPAAPSVTFDSPAASASTMRGEVVDTTNLPVSGANVQVLAPGSSTSAVTDGNGQFVLPWPFSGTVTVRVSKEGFLARERPVPEPGSPRLPVFLRFDLEATDRPVVVAGNYQLTLTAANECTALPNAARQRTYRSQVYPTSRVGWFSVELSGGDFPYSSFVSAEVREPLRTLRLHLVTEVDWVNPTTTILERIGPDMLLEFTGSADLPLGADSAAAAFDGTLSVCPAEAAVPSQTPYRCPVPPLTCRSANHRLTLTRQ
jgi:hypothetical protein